MDNENHTATNSLLKRRLEFTIGILENSRVAQRYSVNFSHAASQVSSGSTSENEHFVRCLHQLF